MVFLEEYKFDDFTGGEPNMKGLRPEWMTQALKEGWTPPKDWVDPEKK